MGFCVRDPSPLNARIAFPNALRTPLNPGLACTLFPQPPLKPGLARTLFSAWSSGRTS